jgi:hypothetical protein
MTQQWTEQQMEILNRVAAEVYSVDYDNAKADGDDVEGVALMTPSETVFFLQNGDGYSFLEDGEKEVLFGSDDDGGDTPTPAASAPADGDVVKLSWEQLDVLEKYKGVFEDPMSPQDLWDFIQYGGGHSSLTIEDRITLDAGDTIPLFPAAGESLKSVLAWVTSKVGWLSPRPYHFKVDGFHGALTIGGSPKRDGDLIINGTLCYLGKSHDTFLEVANGNGWHKLQYVMHVLDEVYEEGYSRWVQAIVTLYRDGVDTPSEELNESLGWVKKVVGKRFPSFD